MTNIQMKYHDGQSWVDLFPKTNAMLVELDTGETIQSYVTSIAQRLDTKATLAEVEAEIQSLIGGAPEALDTLHELAEALGKDANFATTIMNNLSEKVDKVPGKALSTNDFTTSLRTKLNNLPATVYSKTEIDSKLLNIQESNIPVSTTPPTGVSVWFEVV